MKIKGRRGFWLMRGLFSKLCLLFLSFPYSKAVSRVIMVLFLSLQVSSVPVQIRQTLKQSHYTSNNFHISSFKT